MKLKRIIFYCLLPFVLMLALIGFPMPVAPRQAVKARQEQSASAEKQR